MLLKRLISTLCRLEFGRCPSLLKAFKGVFRGSTPIFLAPGGDVEGLGPAEGPHGLRLPRPLGVVCGAHRGGSAAVCGAWTEDSKPTPKSIMCIYDYICMIQYNISIYVLYHIIYVYLHIFLYIL